MIACRFFALRTAIVVLTSIVATGIAQAQVFYWDGGDGSSTDIQEASNWSTDVAPSIAANPATDELHFGPASFTVVDHSVQLYIDQIIFDAGAPAYTFNKTRSMLGKISRSTVARICCSSIIARRPNPSARHSIWRASGCVHQVPALNSTRVHQVAASTRTCECVLNLPTTSL